MAADGLTRSYAAGSSGFLAACTTDWVRAWGTLLHSGPKPCSRFLELFACPAGAPPKEPSQQGAGNEAGAITVYVLPAEACASGWTAGAWRVLWFQRRRFVPGGTMRAGRARGRQKRRWLLCSGNRGLGRDQEGFVIRTAGEHAVRCAGHSGKWGVHQRSMYCSKEAAADAIDLNHHRRRRRGGLQFLPMINSSPTDFLAFRLGRRGFPPGPRARTRRRGVVAATA